MHGRRATTGKLAGAVLAGGAAAFALAGSLLAGFSSCTTFDGLSAARARPETGAGGSIVPADAADSGGGPGGYLSLQDAVRVCALAFTCPKLPRSIIESVSVPIDSSNFAVCVDWLAGPIDPGHVGIVTQASVLKCIAASGSCAEAGRCTAFEYFGKDDPRCLDGGPPDATDWTACAEDGGTLLYCSTKYYDNLAVHCTGVNFDNRSRCLEGKDGQLACAIDETCPGPTCEGTFFYDTCSSYADLHVRFNCSAGGRTCGQDDAGYIGCITGEQFEQCSLYAIKCADSRVRVCDGAYQAYYDCAALGGTCAENGAMAHCSRPGDSCDPADFTKIVCEGDTLQLCVGGAPVAFDCSSVGLACKPAQLPSSATCG
jgi:hypothetical protein